jgi:hypothetical protein
MGFAARNPVKSGLILQPQPLNRDLIWQEIHQTTNAKKLLLMMPSQQLPFLKSKREREGKKK